MRYSLVLMTLVASLFTTAKADPTVSKPAQAIEWHGHYLVLQGENFLPVVRGFVTPNVTIFEVEEGYLPSSPFSKVDPEEACQAGETEQIKGRAVTDTGVATTRAIEAADHGSAANERQRADARRLCPESLGEIWGSGSYVYDSDFNQLAGQEFSEGAKLRRGSFFFEDHDEPEEFLVINEGGARRADDPALDIYSYNEGTYIVDYPVQSSSGRQGEAGIGEDGTPPAPDLPVTFTYKVGTETVVDDSGYLPVDDMLDALNAALPEAPADAGNDGEKRGDVLIVSRGATPETEKRIEERLDAIQKLIRQKVGNDMTISTVSFGDALPLCNDETPECWSKNRSTLVYFGLK